MDNVVIPNAPDTAPIAVATPYTKPPTPIFGDYTRVAFNTSTGEILKDPYVKSKKKALNMHILSIILGLLFPLFYGIGDFYCGRVAKGFAKMFTGGGLVIWQIVDTVKVSKGEYDTKGKCILV